MPENLVIYSVFSVSTLKNDACYDTFGVYHLHVWKGRLKASFFKRFVPLPRHEGFESLESIVAVARHTIHQTIADRSETGHVVADSVLCKLDAACVLHRLNTSQLWQC